MPRKTIRIKASDYRYPSRDELREIYNINPDLHAFGYMSEYPMTALISMKKGIKEVHRDDHLQYWDRVLLNRNGMLSRTYHNAMVHYMRGFPDDESAFEHEHYINRIQFDQYAEIFYYHFSTVKDTIGQILNVYYSMGFDVTKLFFKNVLAKIPDQAVLKAITDFNVLTEVTTEYRNSFTHRTPINYPDSRSTIDHTGDSLIYGSANHNFVKSSVIRDNMESTFVALAGLLDTLKILLPQKISGI